MRPAPEYLLDTNVLSEPIWPSPHPNVVRLPRANEFVLAVAATTWHETLFGMRRLRPASQDVDVAHARPQLARVERGPPRSLPAGQFPRRRLT